MRTHLDFSSPAPGWAPARVAGGGRSPGGGREAPGLCRPGGGSRLPALGTPWSRPPSRPPGGFAHLRLFELQQPQHLVLSVVVLGTGVREDEDEGARVGDLHRSLDGPHAHLGAVATSLEDGGVSGAAAHLPEVGPAQGDLRNWQKMGNPIQG